MNYLVLLTLVNKTSREVQGKLAGSTPLKKILNPLTLCSFSCESFCFFHDDAIIDQSISESEQMQTTTANSPPAENYSFIFYTE